MVAISRINGCNIPFFERLAGASDKNVIAPMDVFRSSTKNKRSLFPIRLDRDRWNPDLVQGNESIPVSVRNQQGEYLELIYDTHPTRATLLTSMKNSHANVRAVS